VPCKLTRCNTLQHTATHCNTLQHTATYCNIRTWKSWKLNDNCAMQINALQHAASTLHHAATHCSILQHTVAYYNTPQRIATHFPTVHPEAVCNFNVLHLIATQCNAYTSVRSTHASQHTATPCNALQHTAAPCNTLQRNTTHCNRLQHAATQSTT